MRIHTIAVLAVAVAFASSCNKSDAPPAPAPGAADPKPAPKEEPPAKGLAAKANDPAVVTLAKAAITCKPDGSRLEWNCDGFKAWRDSELFKDAKSDATLVNLLEDTDEKVRFLGADRFAERATEDAAVAKRVVAAAQAETSTLVADRLGKALGKLDEKTGVAADVGQIIADSKLADLRVGAIIGGASNPALFDAILKVAAESTDDKMRLAAEGAFYNNTPAGKEADVCKMWLANVDHENAEIAGEGAHLTGRVSSCKQSWDSLLDKIDARVKAGTVGFHQMAAALNWLHDGSESTAPQKKRAITIAKALVSNTKIDAFIRSRAIEFLGPNDPAFVGKFKKDKDPTIKEAAEKALKK
jgi:hypothetical protein